MPRHLDLVACEGAAARRPPSMSSCKHSEAFFIAYEMYDQDDASTTPQILPSIYMYGRVAQKHARLAAASRRLNFSAYPIGMIC